MKLSIIIPIYNSERYLADCISSILKQKVRGLEYEIILVNDGSTDKSLNICRKFVNQNRNIQLINQKNSGVSVARNSGILVAKGEYIFFIDSDDLMCDDFLFNLTKDLDYQYDMIFGNFISWNRSLSSKRIWNDIRNINLNTRSTIGDLCINFAKRDWQIPWNPYQAVYKRNIIVENNILFNRSLTVGEDCDFFFRYIEFVRNFKVELFNFVIYRIEENNNSLVKNYNYENISSQLNVFSKYYNKYYNNKIMRKYFADRFANVTILIGKIPEKKDKNKCIEIVKEKKDILNNTTGKFKYVLLKYISIVFGLEVGITVTASFRNIKRKIRRVNA